MVSKDMQTQIDEWKRAAASLSGKLGKAHGEIDSLQSQLDEARRIIGDLRGGKIEPFPNLQEKTILEHRIEKLNSELEAARWNSGAYGEVVKDFISECEFRRRVQGCMGTLKPLYKKSVAALRQQAKEDKNENI